MRSVVDQQALDKAPDRRLSRATLTQQLEEALRVDIIQGVLPPGQRLRAGDLARRYGVSATPFREALQRLAAQNLVDLDPRIGATVAFISLPELRDIYSMRELLEVMALERSIQHGDKAWEDNVTRAWEDFRRQNSKGARETREDAVAWLNGHRTFHNALVSGGDSPWLIRFVGTLADHSERYRMLSARTHRRASLAEHEEIYEAAIRRDAETAKASLLDHLRRTVEVVEEGLTASNGSRS